MMNMSHEDESNDFEEDLFSIAESKVKKDDIRNIDEITDEIFLGSTENVEISIRPNDDPPIENKAINKTDNSSTPKFAPKTKTTNKDRFFGIPESKSMDENYTYQKPNGYSTNDENKYYINISLSEPKKLGEGMNAYVCYKIVTKTDSPDFKSQEFEVFRRFSDFLGLHEKLSDKYLRKGRIIPHPPEKNALGSTKIKMSKEEAGSTEFVEHRRAALERFLNAIGKHPYLRSDPTFVDFLEVSGELPRSVSTSALSSAGVLRLIGKVGDTFSKITYHMEESDIWFSDKSTQVDIWEEILRNLHASFESLAAQRKDLSNCYGQFSRSIGALGSIEEHTGLSRALSELDATGKTLENIYNDQSDVDFYRMAEILRDQIGYFQSIKDIFNERVKLHKAWKDEEILLNKRRETKAKLELARKFDKIPGAESDVTDSEYKLEKSHEDFELISKTIISEVSRFESQRFVDLKSTCIAYIEALLIQEENVTKCWESFQLEASSIS